MAQGQDLCFWYTPGPCLFKPLYAHTVKDYVLTVEDIDYFVRSESSEYVLVGLADIGISQDEFLFGGNLIARPDTMTGVQSQTTEYQDMVSTNKGKEADLSLNLITKN